MQSSKSGSWACSRPRRSRRSHLLSKARDRFTARQGVTALLALFEVAPVSRDVLEGALALGFRDFEDAVLHEAGRLAGAEVIVTRNAADFRQSILPVYTPLELAALLP